MSPQKQAVELLEKYGLRPTQARCLILKTLLEKRIHPTAYELLEIFNSEGEKASIATLYQNLEKLVLEGLLKRFMDLNGVARFDINPHPHHHLVCSKCGAIDDIEKDPNEQALWTQFSTEASLQKWKFQDVYLEFKGLCPSCQLQPKTSL